MKKILIITVLLLGMTACQNENSKKETSTQNTTIEKTPEKKPAFDHKSYKMKGMIIAKTTFKAFKQKIGKVAAEGGLPAVVNFCHDNALKLTDSMGKAHHVVIKRTSHKLRNPANKPDIDEEAVLNEYLKRQEAQKPMEPIVLKDSEGYVHFYAPIKIKEACLKCHGTPGKEIPESIYKLIKEKYPNDQAVNFKTGDLRGIWNIKFIDK
jgi:hypothetical protein